MDGKLSHPPTSVSRNNAQINLFVKNRPVNNQDITLGLYPKFPKSRVMKQHFGIRNENRKQHRTESPDSGTRLHAFAQHRSQSFDLGHVNQPLVFQISRLQQGRTVVIIGPKLVLTLANATCKKTKNHYLIYMALKVMASCKYIKTEKKAAKGMHGLLQ